MSQFPTQPPYDPLFYESPPVPQKSPRPTSVTAISVIAIILGSLAILSMLCVIPQYFGLKIMPNSAIDGIRNDPLLFAISLVMMVMGLAFGILILVCGINALSLRPWARVWFVRYAVVYFFYLIISLIFNTVVIRPRVEQAMQSALPANSPLNTPQFQTAMQVSRYTGVCFGILFLLWPAAILYYMTRPHVKEAFARGMSGLGDSPSLPPPPSVGQ